MLPHALMTMRAADNIPRIHEGFFLFILFHLKLVVTAPLHVRGEVLLILRTLNRNLLGMY